MDSDTGRRAVLYPMAHALAMSTTSSWVGLAGRKDDCDGGGGVPGPCRAISPERSLLDLTLSARPGIGLLHGVARLVPQRALQLATCGHKPLGLGRGIGV